MATEKEKELATFLADVEELGKLAVQLVGTWNQLQVKATSMAPRYSADADGFMAVPRLFHEVGEMLDGIVDDMSQDGRDTVAVAADNVHDLFDLIQVAQTPRKALTA